MQGLRPNVSGCANKILKASYNARPDPVCDLTPYVLGGVYEIQELAVYEKDAAGAVRGRGVLPVRFVPVTGRLGR